MPANILNLPHDTVLGIEENDHDYHISAEVADTVKGCQQRKLSRTGFVLAFAAVVASQQLFAAQPPDAGQLLPSAPFAPLPPSNPSPVLVTPVDKVQGVPDSEVRIMVSRIRITGNTAFSEAQLQELIAPALEPEPGTPPDNGAIAGRRLTFAELQALAERITTHYREHGYLLARAYFPAQEVAQGQLEMTVLEGRISRINWRNDSRHADTVVQGRLADLSLDAPLDNLILERSLLLLNDLPGSDVQATVRPGVSVGTSELDIQMNDRKGLLSGNVSLDNEGNRYSGEYRLGAGLSLNSPLHLGDSLDLRLLGGGRGYHYGRLAWQTPLGQRGLSVGVAASSMDYRLQENFAPLQAHGTAQIGSVYALYPLLRSRFSNVSAQLAYDHKQLDDRVDANASIVNRTLNVWQAGLSGSRTDGLGGGGLNSWSLTAVAGNLSLDPTAQAIDAATVRTEGNYGKGVAQFARTQRLADAWNLYGQISGQSAQKNLDSSEKYSLGGSSTVRAYPQGEAPVDDGWVNTVELRYTPTPNWQASLFNDAAQGRLQHSPAITASRNERRLSGYGLGLTYAQTGGLSVQLTLAWRSGETPTADNDRSPRGWLRLLHSF